MTDSCKIAQVVREHIIDVDDPARFIQTLDYMYEDAIRGTTFDCASPDQRGDVHSHYKHLRKLLNELNIK
jgi:hypothetical protein